MEMKVGQKNSVCILSSRERGARGLASHRILQQLVEEKTQRMKWQSQVTDAQIFDTSSVDYRLSSGKRLLSTHVSEAICCLLISSSVNITIRKELFIFIKMVDFVLFVVPTVDLYYLRF